MKKLISYFTTVFLLIGCLGINSGIEQKVIFNKVDNLAVGTAVVLNGYPVGNVASVRLDESYRIEAVLALDKGVQFPLDSRFICTQQMLGGSLIQVVPGNNTVLLDGTQTLLGETREAFLTNASDSLANQAQPIRDFLNKFLGNEKQDSILNELKRLNEWVDKLEKRMDGTGN